MPPAAAPPTTPFQARLVRFDGQVIEANLNAAPLNFQGHPAICVAARRSAGKEATLPEAQHRESLRAAILETAMDAILSMDDRGNVQEWNPAAEQMFGYPRSEALGKELAQLISPPYLRVFHRQALHRYLSTGEGRILGNRVELTACRRDGAEFPVEVSVVQVRGSQPPFFTGFIRDITDRKLAEAERQRNEALRGAILETALDAILFIDHGGLVQEWNPAAERIFGYRRSEALGRPLDELIIPPGLREVYKDGLANYLMTGVGSLINRPIELTLMRVSGEEFRAELAITRVAKEGSLGCTALIRDITRRRKSEAALRQSEERFRSLIENVKDYAIYMLDAEGRVATWTLGAEQVEGYQAAEIIGQPFSAFFTPEDFRQGIPDRILKEAETSGRAVSEGWRLRKNGTRFWSHGILTAIRDESGALQGFSKVGHDITERKQAEETINNLNEELERRVLERTAQLEAANQELEAFSYSVSHDLRTPLRHIAGYIAILHAEVSAKLPERIRQHMRTISDAAKHMGDLIDALLEFSRMGRSEMHEEIVDLSQLVEKARQQLHRDLEGRSIDWQIGELPEVRGDPFMLRLVVLNLVSNALKYTRPRKKPRIEIASETSGNEVIVHVRDNGVGFDMKYAEKLFGVFQRLHRSEEFEGTGIGLANVRRIIHRHGGRTWAEAKLDAGATFYFSLPLAPPAKGPP